MSFLAISDNWTIITCITTVLACIIGGIYTVVTYNIFNQNKKANELSAYLSLKKDLTSEIFSLVTYHCNLNTIIICPDNSIIDGSGYGYESTNLKVNRNLFIRDILGNIEDLALFYQRGILSLDLIDSGYGYSMLHIGNNEEVRNMLLKLRNGGNVYCGFEDLYKKIYGKLDKTESSKFRNALFD